MQKIETTSYNTFSLDIETGGVDKQKSPVLTIGVVYGNLITGQIISAFYVRIDPASMPHRTWDEDTMNWWDLIGKSKPRSLSEVTREGGDRLDVKDALIYLKNWMSIQPGADRSMSVFGKGPEFDNEFLEILYRENNLTPPWRFRFNQSHRTLLWLHDTLLEAVEIDYEATAHHALTDALDEFVSGCENIRAVVKEELLPEKYKGTIKPMLTTYDINGDLLEKELSIY